MVYDSTADTVAHIEKVGDYLNLCRDELYERVFVHDESKLEEPEKSIFDTVSVQLKTLKYGTDEYFAQLALMKPALDHHYAHNSHHPEHYPNGVYGMDLFDVIEMLCDWKAASERMDNGNIYTSIEQNQKRFKYDDEFKGFLTRTALKLGWE
jgi:hypothetical protein